MTQATTSFDPSLVLAFFPQELLASRGAQQRVTTVGSISLRPHACTDCHKQYASRAKLLQHQRKSHLQQQQQVIQQEDEEEEVMAV